MSNLEAATKAFDEARAAGKTPAQALGAAAEADGRFINDVFNDLLSADVLRFVAIDRRAYDKKNGEGRPLVRVVNPRGRKVVNGRLV